MKLKTSLFYSLAAATLLSGVANAQTATDPVGFHTINVFGALPGGPAYSLISAGLVNPIEYASGTTSIAATTITVDGTPFAAINYGMTSGSDVGGVPEAPYIAYYVEVTDGAEAGAWANITANTDSTLTVDRNLSAAGAAKIAIRKHVTIADLFGVNNEAGINGSDDAASADQVQLYANGVSSIVIYDDVTVGGNGWFNPDFSNYEGNTRIEPQQGVLVRRIVAGAVSFTRAGHVKVGPTKLLINENYNAVANPRAVGKDDTDAPVFTLDASDLYTGVAGNSVAGADDGAIADEVIFLNSDGTTSTYIYDDVTLPATEQGWFPPDFSAPAGDVVIENGVGFLLRRKAAGSFIWTAPAEVIAP